jgi:peptidoglycan glycosyltransferase
VNRALKRISIAVLVMFLALLVNVNYLQAFEAPSLASGLGNVRTLDEQSQIQRGSIVTSDGMTIAESKPVSGGYQRVYPGGAAFAPVTGFEGVNGDGGMEQAEDSLLSGTGSKLAFHNFIDMITNKPQQGATVELTINSKAQEAAYSGLQSILSGTNRVGGVVAIDPSTGAILAMASYPSYDPNQFATADGAQFNALDKKLISESPSPLINNATQTTLPPGSTFKLVTGSAYFTQNPSATTSTEVYSPLELQLPQSNQILHNDAGTACGSAGANGKVPIIDAFAMSCDTTFANIGMSLGSTTLNAMAQKFGFDNSSQFIPGVTIAPSNYTVTPSSALTAYTAIGQWDDTATPLQEAMDAATIANNGVEMKPYLVQQVTASDLSVQSTAPVQMSQPITPAVAGKMQQMMTAVVQQPDGTGYAYRASQEGGLVIAGKTGTAQTIVGSGVDDAAFVAFAPVGSPKIAVGVMVQGAGYGAAAAAPIAVSVIKAYLASVGQG